MPNPLSLDNDEDRSGAYLVDFEYTNGDKTKTDRFRIPRGTVYEEWTHHTSKEEQIKDHLATIWAADDDADREHFEVTNIDIVE